MGKKNNRLCEPSQAWIKVWIKCRTRGSCGIGLWPQGGSVAMVLAGLVFKSQFQGNTREENSWQLVLLDLCWLHTTHESWAGLGLWRKQAVGKGLQLWLMKS